MSLTVPMSEQVCVSERESQYFPEMPEPITCVYIEKERQKQEEADRQKTRFIFKLANMIIEANE